MTKLHGEALAVGSLEASPQLSETLASRKGENGSKTIEINKKQNKENKPHQEKISVSLTKLKETVTHII